MRWSIIRTIWFREMRDQVRDRRTLFMILGLPLLLYPVLGMGVLQFAKGFTEKPSLIGIVGTAPPGKDLPPADPKFTGHSPLPLLALLTATPVSGSEQWTGACVLFHLDQLVLDYPPLLENGRFTSFERRNTPRQVRDWLARLEFVYLAAGDDSALAEHRVDLLMEAPDNLFEELEKSQAAAVTRPMVRISGRRDDDISQLAMRRIAPLVEAWKDDLKRARLARKGLSTRYIDPVEVRFPQESDGAAAQGITDLLVRLFPFMIVLWSLAGALYPAVDLCAGEKERGTMETLLITPAGREEIVLGKFLTIWVFSSATALLNLLSIGVTTRFSGFLPHGGISVEALAWCVVLSLPQSAFFSAISLAIGAYARSSKEGQYYLMPMFLLTMPLIFLTLAPGVELNAFYSMIPVTGVALLMQRLMTAASLSDIPWAYFVPVLGPMALYSWLALRWAIEQFNREEVLFREAERLDMALWLRRLFREKEPLPTTGEAFFCLALLIGLRWMSLGLGNRWSLEVETTIGQLAFVMIPALFMALLLNTHPSEGLYLRWPSLREAGLAALLAILLLPPMAALAEAVVLWSPQLLHGKHALITILQAIRGGQDLAVEQLLSYFLAFAVVPAVCEEVAFRGYVLHGLHQRFPPRRAILLSSFFFALYHMNVFLFVPAFILGVVLGLLTVRSRSLLPAVLFHLLYNSVLIVLITSHGLRRDASSWIEDPIWLGVIGTCLIVAAMLLWWLYRKPYVEKALQEAEERKLRQLETPAN
jgi:sodium transport system permease protein